MLVYYCARCARQNPSPMCGQCGRSLGNPSVRYVWEDSRLAVNDPARLSLLVRIAMGAVALAVAVMLAMEFILGGPGVFSTFFRSTGILLNTVGLGLGFLLLGGVLLVLQGRESVQYMLDPKGVLKRTWIEPTRARCWSRFIRYDKAAFQQNSLGKPFLLAHEEYLVWSDAARYRLSPSTGRITLYRPYAFVFMVLHLPRNEYAGAAEMVGAKLKNRK